MEEYDNAIPIHDSKPHIRSINCECQPSVVTFNGQKVLFHQAWDKRWIWMEVETMLGFRCEEHGLYLDRDTHRHVPRPEAYCEYFPHPPMPDMYIH